MCVYSWRSFSTQLLLTHSSAPQIPAPLVSLNSYPWLISVRPCALLALHSKHYLPPGRKMMPSHALYFHRDRGIALWSNSQKFSFLTSNDSFFFSSPYMFCLVVFIIYGRREGFLPVTWLDVQCLRLLTIVLTTAC